MSEFKIKPISRRDLEDGEQALYFSERKIDNPPSKCSKYKSKKLNELHDEMKLKTSSFESFFFSFVPKYANELEKEKVAFPDFNDIFSELLEAIEKDNEIYGTLRVSIETDYNTYSILSNNDSGRPIYLSARKLQTDSSYKGIKEKINKRLKEEVCPLYSNSTGSIEFGYKKKNEIEISGNKIWLNCSNKWYLLEYNLLCDNAEKKNPEIFLRFTKTLDSSIDDAVINEIVKNAFDIITKKESCLNEVKLRNCHWVLQFNSQFLNLEAKKMIKLESLTNEIDIACTKTDKLYRFLSYSENCFVKTECLDFNRVLESSEYPEELKTVTLNYFDNLEVEELLKQKYLCHFDFFNNVDGIKQQKEELEETVLNHSFDYFCLKLKGKERYALLIKNERLGFCVLHNDRINQLPSDILKELDKYFTQESLL